MVEYTYDAIGNQTSVTETDGRVTCYTYDGMGRLSRIEYPLFSKAINGFISGAARGCDPVNVVITVIDY